MHEAKTQVSQPQTYGSPPNAVGAGLVVGILAMMVIPAAIALHSVKKPAILHVLPDASPHGYTWSLLLFIVPILVIAIWFLPSAGLEIPQRAFWRTIGVLVPIGCLLDVIFAQWFFYYPNPQSTLRVLAPAFGRWVPVEEYVFYFTGFIMILLLYVWLSEYWLAAYTVHDYRGEAQALPKLLKFHPMSLLVGIGLIAAAVIYKKWFSPVQHGFPGYFIVLVVGGLVPSASLYPVARRFINWRALSLTMFLILLISMLWEATLALPYGWWNYQHPAMVGIFIGAWSDLPIEAVLVWLAVTYGTVILFEAVKIWQASGRRARQAFLGEQ
ncbi:MAG TPA: hypothetical protein VMG82_15210 [Candidatus Sulfotelmatobacter sp.]|nr:hypothetical protein [Candidatus Sulfotelmatobacter sp.]